MTRGRGRVGKAPRKALRRPGRRNAFKEIVDSPFAYFVRFPPNEAVFSQADLDAGRFPPLDVMTDLRGNVSDYQASVLICGSLNDYRESRDPLSILEAFCVAVKTRVYPPIEILEHLEKVFTRYLGSKGKVPLDQVFFETKKGEWSRFTKQGQRVMQKFVATLIYQAKIVFGESTEHAAARVRLALEHHQQRLGFLYETESLIRKYPAWKKQFHLDEADHSNPKHPDNPHLKWDAARRRRFLSEPNYSLF